MAAQRAFIHLDTSSRVARATDQECNSPEQEDICGWRPGGLPSKHSARWKHLVHCFESVIGIDPHHGIWLLREGVPVLCIVHCCEIRSANECESLAYSILNNIPALPETVTMGQQRCMMDDQADKTGKAARSSASAAPILAHLKEKMKSRWQQWTAKTIGRYQSQNHAIRARNKKRYHEDHPLQDGDVPEGFGGRRATRKIYEDGSKKASESMLGVNNVDWQAWTGFTVFCRVTDPLAAMVAADESFDPALMNDYIATLHLSRNVLVKKLQRRKGKRQEH